MWQSVVMSEPLTNWKCDSCGDAIVEPAKALVVARYDRDRHPFGWLIVHKGDCDPAGYMFNVELTSFLGAEGLAHLLAFLSAGPLKGGGASRIADFDGFVDLVRRVQTPYYEEARPRFDDEDVHDRYDDANEYFPYLPKQLQKIAAK
ncbi:hypothetical protein A3L23_05201 (plasmid) [Rhodococcoides fascians D188]|jgi:hypothetical protein|nr:hypothetical protein A3L23_05201 [Rhodococcus fascians D188]